MATAVFADLRLSRLLAVFTLLSLFIFSAALPIAQQSRSLVDPTLSSSDASLPTLTLLPSDTASAVKRANNAVPTIKSTADASKYISAFPANKAMLWSKLPIDLTKTFAKSHGYQTLEMSVPDSINNHPENQNKDGFWAYFSQAFVDKVVATSTEVTIELNEPTKKLTGPSDPYSDGRLMKSSHAGSIEIPTVKKKAGMVIYAMHPKAKGAAANERYEMWPQDKAYEWQKKYNIMGAGDDSSDCKASTAKNSGTKGSTASTGSKSCGGKTSSSSTKSADGKSS